MNVTRRLGNWIESYQEYTEILPSPQIYRKWVAIFFVAAAMERKVWVRTMGSDLFPNLYVFLIGPSGIGKGQSLYLGESLLRNVPDLCIGPSDMTAASLIDALHEASRHLILQGGQPYVEFNSLTVISRELGVLIPSWESALMNNLTDIYDGQVIEQKRRGKDLRIKIESPQINFLGACTPAYLNEVMPQGAWDQGFISRTLMIYSGQRFTRDPFTEETLIDKENRLYGDLLHDLKTIALEFGQMSFTKPVVAAIRAWQQGGQQPAPQHSRLQHYNSRRLTHLLKLCMISSMSHSSDKVIGIDNYAEALNWLIEAETYMPDIFKSMVSGGDSTAMEETWNFVWTLYSKEHKPIGEHRIVHFLRERVAAHSVMRVLDIMVKAHMFKLSIGDNGFTNYTPTSREERLSGSAGG